VSTGIEDDLCILSRLSIDWQSIEIAERAKALAESGTALKLFGTIGHEQTVFIAQRLHVDSSQQAEPAWQP
jgi:hypothetical protein